MRQLSRRRSNSTSLCSERKLVEHLHHNVLFEWFVGRSLDDAMASEKLSAHRLATGGGMTSARRRDAMPLTQPQRHRWKALLDADAPLQLPAAHDALTAKLIERAGFRAYQIGGFALVGARHGLPDVDLTRVAEQVAGVEDIIAACDLPVLVDVDDGYGDAKNVTHTIVSYESMGVSAVFIEDQKPPKRCGHMSGKEVVPADIMVQRIEAAVAARRCSDFFIVARTDALGVEGMDAALKRADRYLNAGADGIYVEAPTSVEQLQQIGAAFKGVPQMTNMFEGDNETPWLTPMELHTLGFSMILYPTSFLFRVVRSIEQGLADLRQGKRTEQAAGIDLTEWERIVNVPYWATIEKRFSARP